LPRLLASQHGSQRWQAGWSLAEVVRDYRILRLVILAHLEEKLERALLVREAQAVGLALDEAIEASVECYARNRETQERQLHEALQEADRRKNEFLAMLAHELRNPLASLRNTLEVVRLAEDAPEPLRQGRDMMARQVSQMSRLVDDLLDVARIAQGKLDLQVGKLDLRSAVQEAVQMNLPLREAHRHALSVSLPEEPLWVEGDEMRVVQIVVNLLNNSSKYTPDGGNLSLAACLEGDEVVVRVKDDGIGIPPEKIVHIFDLFAQIDLGVERTHGGLGIGLALVRRLVELHGGGIRAISEGEGRGSEFVVRLPAAAAGHVLEAHRTTEADVPAPSRHILIVEDNEDGRESLATLLRLLGHRVDTAADGALGVAAALEGRPEVALVDIGLPVLDGYEVARQVRAGLGAGVYLVALTGYGRPDDQARAAEAGFNAHLLKPVDPEMLQRMLTTPLAENQP
jgi:signal transduction histidine kinase/CheY-like chemotaxis protein